MRDCMYCDELFTSTTELGVHLGTVHADMMGSRARTRRRWTCWRCATENSPRTDTCTACGFVHPYSPGGSLASISEGGDP